MTRTVRVITPPGLFAPETVLVSTHAAPAPLAGDGTGEAAVQSGSVQLIATALPGPGGTVEGAALLGFALVFPDVSEVTIDTASTALALVFLTPGVTTLEASAARSRQTEIINAGAFGTLQAYVAGRVGTVSLAELRDDAQFHLLLEQVLSEFPDVPTSPSTGVSRDPEVSAQVVESGARIANRGWRAVVAVRDAQDLSGISLSSPAPLFVEGNRAQQGTMFSQGQQSDAVTDALDGSGAGILRYSVYGPGVAEETGSVPSFTEAWGPSFAYALVLPVVDLVLGSTEPTNRGYDAARALWAQAGSGALGDVAAPAREAIRARNEAAAANAMPAALETMFATLESFVLLYGLVPASLPVTGTVGVTPSAYVAALLRAVGQTVGSAHCLPAVRQWLSYPETATFDLPITNGEVIVR